MTDKTLAERLRDAEADEKRLTDELLRAYRAGEFWLTPCASVALDAKDAEIARLKGALTEIAEPMRDQRTLTPTHVFVDRLIWIQDRARSALRK